MLIALDLSLGHGSSVKNTASTIEKVPRLNDLAIHEIGEACEKVSCHPARMRQIWATTKQSTTPIPTGSRAETVVHLMLLVSFQMV